MMQNPLDFTPKLNILTQVSADQRVWRKMEGVNLAEATAESHILQTKGQLVLMGDTAPGEAMTLQEITMTALELVMVIALSIAFVVGVVEFFDRTSVTDIVDWMLEQRAGTARLF